jgi:hypothetical protein
MRISFFDTILETHVPDSLERALVARGHEVLTTGRVWKGFAFPTEDVDLRRLTAAVDRVLEWKPDVLLCFRPAALPPPLLGRLERAGIHLMTWLSDDPVFWGGTYGHVADAYRTVLHCGAAPVLDFYERAHGRPTGVNMPFFTDGVAFPHRYDPDRATYDVLFLGNVDTGVRAGRYGTLAGLGADVHVHGRIGDDPAGIGRGYLDSDAEVQRAAAGARVGLSIPQFFRDYADTEHDFPGLGALGHFQYPSRVVQYAAMGLPVVSASDPDLVADFPELVVTTEEPDALRAAVAGLLADRAALRDRGAATYQRFRRQFSAASRAMLLEHLVAGDGWRKLDTPERTALYAEFDGTAGEPDLSARPDLSAAGAQPAAEAQRPRVEVTEPAVPSFAGLRVAIAGVGWRRPTSVASVTERAFVELGATVRRVPNSELAASTEKGAHWALSPAVLGTATDLVVDCGGVFGATEPFLAALRRQGARLLVHGLTGAVPDGFKRTLARSADLVTCQEGRLAELLAGTTATPVRYLPPLVDAEFVRRSAGSRSGHLDPAVCLVSDTPSALAQVPDLGDTLGGLPVARWAPADAAAGDGDPLDAVAAGLAHAVDVVLSPSRLATPVGREVLPFALASGALVCAPRGLASQLEPVLGTAVVGFRTAHELDLKLGELLADPALADSYRAAGADAATGRFSAERHLGGVLAELGLVPAATKRRWW